MIFVPKKLFIVSADRFINSIGEEEAAVEGRNLDLF
jgi:hypothetical protein